MARQSAAHDHRGVTHRGIGSLATFESPRQRDQRLRELFRAASNVPGTVPYRNLSNFRDWIVTGRFSQGQFEILLLIYKPLGALSSWSSTRVFVLANSLEAKSLEQCHTVTFFRFPRLDCGGAFARGATMSTLPRAKSL
jgi:hypothetical protein